DFMAAVLPVKPERIIVMEPRFLDHAESLLNAANFAEIKGWMLVKYINNVARFLSQAFREAAFPFNQAITGTPQLPTQITQAYRLANSARSEERRVEKESINRWTAKHEKTYMMPREVSDVYQKH